MRLRASIVGLAIGLGLCTRLLAGCGDDDCSNPSENTLGELTAWEQGFLAGPTIESPPPGFLEAEDGLGLAYHDWVPGSWDGSGPVVLLVPGSSAYAELYAALGQGLRERGSWRASSTCVGTDDRPATRRGPAASLPIRLPTTIATIAAARATASTRTRSYATSLGTWQTCGRGGPRRGGW